MHEQIDNQAVAELRLSAWDKCDSILCSSIIRILNKQITTPAEVEVMSS